MTYIHAIAFGGGPGGYPDVSNCVRVGDLYRNHTEKPLAGAHQRDFYVAVLGGSGSNVTFDLEPKGTFVKLTPVHDDFVSDSEMLRSTRDGRPALRSNLKTLRETGKSMTGRSRERRSPKLRSRSPVFEE